MESTWRGEGKYVMKRGNIMEGGEIMKRERGGKACEGKKREHPQYCILWISKLLE